MVYEPIYLKSVSTDAFLEPLDYCDIEAKSTEHCKGFKFQAKGLNLQNIAESLTFGHKSFRLYNSIYTK